MNRERVTHKTVASLRAPATLDATGSSAYVDTQGYDAAEVVVHHGDVTAAAGANNLALKLQHADATPGAAGSYEDVPAADLRGTFALLENGVTAGVQRVAYVGGKRYLRLVATETGTAAAVVGVLAVLELSDREPANAKTAVTGSVT